MGGRGRACADVGEGAGHGSAAPPLQLSALPRPMPTRHGSRAAMYLSASASLSDRSAMEAWQVSTSAHAWELGLTSTGSMAVAGSFLYLSIHSGTPASGSPGARHTGLKGATAPPAGAAPVACRWSSSKVCTPFKPSSWHCHLMPTCSRWGGGAGLFWRLRAGRWRARPGGRSMLAARLAPA